MSRAKDASRCGRQGACNPTVLKCGSGCCADDMHPSSTCRSLQVLYLTPSRMQVGWPECGYKEGQRPAFGEAALHQARTS